MPVNSIAGRAAFLLLAAGGLPADAMGAGALADTDLNPLTVVFGFPDSTEGATLRPDGQHGLSLTLASASHNVESLEANERLAYDGETSRLAMAWRYGVSDRLELGGEVSYLWHHSGNLDSLIDDWHDFFGLPNGPRDRREQDQLDFSYLDDQGSSVNLHHNTHGPGDVRLMAGWQLPGSRDHRRALRFSIKLPTGNTGRILGSGGTDFSLGLAGDVAAIRKSSRWSGHYRADVIRIGRPEFLSGRSNPVVGQLAGGLSYKAGTVDLKAQGRVRSALYESAIRNLGGVSVHLVFGAEFRMPRGYALALSVGEDVRPDTAPDVTFQVALRYVGR
ncbi:MAG: DUF3187 family protein [Woeseia sp.]